eukprot:m.20749 g.20749  ORF g.20749 m.20749 type:complete len:603 (+) comp28075_c0_seq2:217-2025(+)
MPSNFSKPSRRPFFSAKRYKFDEDFKGLPERGKRLAGVTIEKIDGEKRPKLRFEDARLETMESPKMEEFAAAVRLVYLDQARPEFCFRMISNLFHPFAGRHYCHYSPEWMRGTSLGKLMIEADIWMKLLAHNTKPSEEGGFIPWNKNTTMWGGLKSPLDMESEMPAGSIFLVCKKVSITSNDDHLRFPLLPEMAIQDDTSSQRSEYFASIYDDIVFDGAPILERIREVPKMIMVAEWLRNMGVEVDEQWLFDSTQPDDSCIPQTYQKLKSQISQKVNSPQPMSLQGATQEEAKEALRRGLSAATYYTTGDVVLTPVGPVRQKVDYEVENLEINGTRHFFEVFQSHFLPGKQEPYLKIKRSFRASADDNDLDWVYDAIDPKMPIDASFQPPSVVSWSDLHQQSIVPFCNAALLCPEVDKEETMAVPIRSLTGGCDMRSFATEQVPVKAQSRPRSRKQVAAKEASSSVATGGGGSDGVSAKAKDLFVAPEGMRRERVGRQNPVTGAGVIHDENGRRVLNHGEMRFSAHQQVVSGPQNGLQTAVCGILPVDLDCAICFEKFSSKNITRLECGHKFHKKCIDKWFERKSTCPKCRQAVPICWEGSE